MRVPARMRQRAVYTRSNADLLREGIGEAYGWVTNAGLVGGTLDDVAAGRPVWWQGEDVFDGRPIGPNGPGDGLGYGGDDRGGWRDRMWWNTGRPQQSMLSAVTRCTAILVNPVVRTPWRIRDPQGVSQPLPLWMRDPTLRGTSPGPFSFPTMPWGLRRSSHEFWQTILTHAIWWGRGAFLAQVESDGYTPKAGTLRIVNPYMIDVDADGHWVIDPNGDNPIRTDFDGRIEVGPVTWRLYVMRGLPPNDDHTSEGVLPRHWDTFRLGASIRSYQLSSFGSGVPAGFLKVTQPNFGEEKAADLKKAWMDAHGGVGKSIAVLNAMVDFTPIAVRPVDNETTLLHNAQLVDVAHAFTLSASFLDTSAGASLTYANMTEKRRELVDISLTGFGQQFMEMLNACLPYGTGVEVAWDRFTAPDLNEQATVLTQAVQSGWLTKDEARARVGLDPLGPGDEMQQQGAQQ